MAFERSQLASRAVADLLQNKTVDFQWLYRRPLLGYLINTWPIVTWPSTNSSRLFSNVTRAGIEPKGMRVRTIGYGDPTNCSFLSYYTAIVFSSVVQNISVQDSII